jgi:hypothetical protein
MALVIQTEVYSWWDLVEPWFKNITAHNCFNYARSSLARVPEPDQTIVVLPDEHKIEADIWWSNRMKALFDIFGAFEENLDREDEIKMKYVTMAQKEHVTQTLSRRIQVFQKQAVEHLNWKNQFKKVQAACCILSIRVNQELLNENQRKDRQIYDAKLKQFLCPTALKLLGTGSKKLIGIVECLLKQNKTIEAYESPVFDTHSKSFGLSKSNSTEFWNYEVNAYPRAIKNVQIQFTLPETSFFFEQLLGTFHRGIDEAMRLATENLNPVLLFALQEHVNTMQLSTVDMVSCILKLLGDKWNVSCKCEHSLDVEAPQEDIQKYVQYYDETEGAKCKCFEPLMQYKMYETLRQPRSEETMIAQKQSGIVMTCYMVLKFLQKQVEIVLSGLTHKKVEYTHCAKYKCVLEFSKNALDESFDDTLYVTQGIMVGSHNVWFEKRNGWPVQPGVKFGNLYALQIMQLFADLILRFNLHIVLPPLLSEAQEMLPKLHFGNFLRRVASRLRRFNFDRELKQLLEVAKQMRSITRFVNQTRHLLKVVL